jgi:hypothetical protein
VLKAILKPIILRREAYQQVLIGRKDRERAAERGYAMGMLAGKGLRSST